MSTFRVQANDRPRDEQLQRRRTFFLLTSRTYSSILLNSRVDEEKMHLLVVLTARNESMQTDEKRAFKNQLYEQFARLGMALASPHSLELLDVLAQCERTVEALAQETGMSIANASQHLQVLRTAHLVEARREGVSMYYRLADEGVCMLWHALRTVGEAQLAEIDRVVQAFVQDRARLQPIDAQELLQRPSNDEV